MTKLYEETDRIKQAKQELYPVLFNSLVDGLTSDPACFTANLQLDLIKHGYAIYTNGGNLVWAAKAELLFRDLAEAKEPRWTTKDGKKLKLAEMSDSHIINSLLVVAKTLPAAAVGTSGFWVRELAKQISKRGLRLSPEGQLRDRNTPKEAPPAGAPKPEPCERKYTHSTEPLTLRCGETVKLGNSFAFSEFADAHLEVGEMAARAHFTVDNTVFIEVIVKDASGQLVWLQPSLLMKAELLRAIEPRHPRAADGRAAPGTTLWYLFALEKAPA